MLNAGLVPPLMPVAIAINIVLGFTVQKVLNLPIYLDSIGTILVGVLAGPLAGALTGALSNLIWQYSPGIGPSSNIGPFAVTAAVIGLLAGLWGYLGVYRPRPASGPTLWIAAIAGAAVVVLLAIRIYTSPAYSDPVNGYPTWVYTAIAVIGVAASLVVSGFVLARRDASGGLVAIAGALTGIVAAIVSAPIAAYVYGGVTGTPSLDLMVAALRQGGADVYNASLGQGLFSDPIDKTITSFVVYIVLSSLSPPWPTNLRSRRWRRIGIEAAVAPQPHQHGDVLPIEFRQFAGEALGIVPSVEDAQRDWPVRGQALHKLRDLCRGHGVGVATSRHALHIQRRGPAVMRKVQLRQPGIRPAGCDRLARRLPRTGVIVAAAWAGLRVVARPDAGVQRVDWLPVIQRIAGNQLPQRRSIHVAGGQGVIQTAPPTSMDRRQTHVGQ